jgi:hypothetical protein
MLAGQPGGRTSDLVEDARALGGVFGRRYHAVFT